MGVILGRKVYQPVPGRIMLRCPGCDDNHGIVVDGTRGWSWNGDGDKPTVSPSILCNATWGNGRKTVCHSFVRDGRWEFLGDCTHDLAGQTVEVPDWPHGADY